jgi:hypothetical protein
MKGLLQTNQKQVDLSGFLTGADNGLTLSGETVQLGQSQFAATGPAAFSNARFIPMNGFSLWLFTRNVYTPGSESAGFYISNEDSDLNVFAAQDITIEGAMGTRFATANLAAFRFMPTTGSGGQSTAYTGQVWFDPSGGNNIRASAFRSASFSSGQSGTSIRELVAFDANDDIAGNTATNFRMRGFYFRPILDAGMTQPARLIAFENTVGDNYFNSTSGSTVVGGGFGTLQASAALQVQSTTKGFLLPRMTTAQKNAITSPAAGLMVYDTTLQKACVYTTSWETITSA